MQSCNVGWLPMCLSKEKETNRDLPLDVFEWSWHDTQSQDCVLSFLAYEHSVAGGFFNRFLELSHCPVGFTSETWETQTETFKHSNTMITMTVSTCEGWPIHSWKRSYPAPTHPHPLAIVKRFFEAVEVGWSWLLPELEKAMLPSHTLPCTNVQRSRTLPVASPWISRNTVVSALSLFGETLFAFLERCWRQAVKIQRWAAFGGMLKFWTMDIS